MNKDLYIYQQIILILNFLLYLVLIYLLWYTLINGIRHLLIGYQLLYFLSSIPSLFFLFLINK